MACCYIAASIIGFIIRGCDALDIKLHLQYNESIDNAYDEWDDEGSHSIKPQTDESGITIISIGGMTCAACTSTVESAITKVPGVYQALVSLPFQEARVLHDGKANAEDIRNAISDVGYDAMVGERPTKQKIDTLKHTEELAELKSSLKGLSFASTVVFSIGSCFEYFQLHRLLNDPLSRLSRSLLLLLLTVLACARYGHWILKNAMSAGRHLRVNMHTLITVSTLTGLTLTSFSIFQNNKVQNSMYFDSILGILLIVTVGRYMDLLSRRRATDTFAGLHSLIDQTTNTKLAKSNKHIPTSFIRSGDEIVVEAFNIVPCDCYIVSGRSHVNEAVLTGESLPKTKGEGDLLLAGSRNGPHRLVARVNQDPTGSFLAQLVKSIEQSLASQVSVQRHVNTITQWFVSLVFLIASAASIRTFHVASANMPMWLALDAAGQRLMTVLAAACPCALGLATPCAVMAGIDASWRQGILMLEGGETMERVRDITHIVMDKTGTLTRGTLTVSELHLNGRWSNSVDTLAALICAAEEKGMAAHPLAMAVFRHFLPKTGNLWTSFQDNGIIKEVIESTGSGVKCQVNLGDSEWRTICIGNMEWLKHNCVENLETLSHSVREGSAVFVGIDGSAAVSMILEDTIRPDAKPTIEALKARGYHLSMLTGDQAAEASRISKVLGIPVMGSAATPDAKLNHIKSIQEKGGKVLMIGDGMNDGPSLATADVGVMMSNGRKCFTSGGSVLLLQPQMSSILTLLNNSRRTMHQVSMNIRWVIVYNVAAVAVAVGLGEPYGIRITPPIAAAMMSVSSLFVTIQGLLLRTKLVTKNVTVE